MAFLYGWSLLLVIQSGGMAAVAITFARYFAELTRAPLSEGAIAALALILLTAINCLGVRAGSNVQSALMVLKIAAIAMLVFCGFWFSTGAQAVGAAIRRVGAGRSTLSFDLCSMGAALTPVMFAYALARRGFVAGEMRDRAGFGARLFSAWRACILLYTAVTSCASTARRGRIGADDHRPPPPSCAARSRERGATLIALGITISTLGFSANLCSTRGVYVRDGGR